MKFIKFNSQINHNIGAFFKYYLYYSVSSFFNLLLLEDIFSLHYFLRKSAYLY